MAIRTDRSLAPQGLNLSVAVRNDDGTLLPGVREYNIYSKVGSADKKIPHTLKIEEGYLTHGWVQHPERSYSVSFPSRAGAGTIVKTQVVSASNKLGAALNLSAGPVKAALSGSGNKDSSSNVSERRDSNVEELEFKIKGGKGAPCEAGSSWIDLYLYTFDPVLAAEQIELAKKLEAFKQGALPPPVVMTSFAVQTSSIEEAASVPSTPLVTKTDAAVQVSPVVTKTDAAVQVSPVVTKTDAAVQVSPGHLMPAFVFGSDQWNEYFGVSVEKIPLPRHMENLLQSEEGKWVAVFIPSEISKQDTKQVFNLVQFQKLLALPIITAIGAKCSETHCLPLQGWGHGQWVLMTTGIMEGTLDKDFLEQKEWIKTKCASYQVPTPFEVAVCTLLYKVQSGKSLFEKNSKGTSLWTRCQKEPGLDWEPVVGGFNEKGMRIVSQENMTRRASNIGMAAVVH